jgi:hypothetical protein
MRQVVRVVVDQCWQNSLVRIMFAPGASGRRPPGPSTTANPPSPSTGTSSPTTSVSTISLPSKTWKLTWSAFPSVP